MTRREWRKRRSSAQQFKVKSSLKDTMKHLNTDPQVQRIFSPPLSGSLIFSSVQQDIFRCSDRIVHLAWTVSVSVRKKWSQILTIWRRFSVLMFFFSYILIIKSHQSIALLSACLRASILLSPCRVIALWQGMMGTEEPFICRLAFISQSHRMVLSLCHRLARPVWCPSCNFAQQQFF